MTRPLIVNRNILIPSSELTVSFVRSSGPGGQNVNKVSSKAELRWNLRATKSLPDEARHRFEKSFPSRVNKSGEVVVTSDRYRDQGRNLADCYEKLRQLIQAALVVPRKRRPTRPTRRSIENRLISKRRQAEIKRGRGFRAGEEE